MGQRAQSVAVDMRGRYVDQKRKSDNFAYWAKWIAIMVTVLAAYAAGYWTATLYLR